MIKKNSFVIVRANDELLLALYPNDKTERWCFCRKPRATSTYKFDGKPMGKVIVL